jgi:hypothetical protein
MRRPCRERGALAAPLTSGARHPAEQRLLTDELGAEVESWSAQVAVPGRGDERPEGRSFPGPMITTEGAGPAATAVRLIGLCGTAGAGKANLAKIFGLLRIFGEHQPMAQRIARR